MRAIGRRTGRESIEALAWTWCGLDARPSSSCTTRTTFEAIDHCRAAGVQIIIAINKVDLPLADVPQGGQAGHRLRQWPTVTRQRLYLHGHKRRRMATMVPRRTCIEAKRC